jgi:drug/metabolite transporter (DMT)-like permease
MVGLGPEGNLAGDVVAMVMTVLMAVMIVLARAVPGMPTLQAACVSGVITALLAAPFGGHAGLDSGSAALLVAFGLVSNTAGLGFFILGSRRLPPVETALVSTLEAPIAPLWVWLLFAETPGTATLAGGGLVMAAVLGHILRETAFPGRRGADSAAE